MGTTGRRVKRLLKLFPPGQIVVFTGWLGGGKTNDAFLIANELRKVDDVTVCTNILTWGKHKNVHIVFTWRKFFQVLCDVRISFFKKLKSRPADWKAYKGNALPSYTPHVLLIIDEVEKVLLRIRPNTSEALDFGKLFVNMLRKLGVTLVLIYHSLEDVPNTFAKDVHTHIHCEKKDGVYKFHPTLQGRRLKTVTMLPKSDEMQFDSFSPAEMDPEDLEMGVVLGVMGRITSDLAPQALKDYLDGNKEDEFPIKDWLDFCTLMHHYFPQMHVKGPKGRPAKLSMNQVAEPFAHMGLDGDKVKERRRKLKKDGIIA